MKCIDNFFSARSGGNGDGIKWKRSMLMQSIKIFAANMYWKRLDSITRIPMKHSGITAATVPNGPKMRE